MSKKTRSQYLCSECGAISVRWVGRCTECGEFGTMLETEVVTGISGPGSAATGGVHAARLALSEGAPESARIASGVGEFDRVLGGGLVPGSVILVGGEPGAGKSTLLLQVADRMGGTGRTVLMVSGEESTAQIELRARRLGCSTDIFLFCETNLEWVIAEAERLAPDLLVIDSIQTLFAPDVESSPGSVTQVKECALRLQRLAKEHGMATCLVGHVTKDGSIAGPRIIEHLVDTVLYFEGERFDAFRVLRAVKNRFGSVSEVGIFEMRDTGLAEVDNPSALFLQERDGSSVSGTAISVTMEGRRPLLVEVQALVTPSFLPVPKRVAAGLDFNRLAINVAVLDRRAGLKLGDRDVFVSVVGGLKVLEPALDLGVCMALASSQKDRPLPDSTAYFGEVSLTGEVRPVAAAESRLREAAKLGFKRVVLPRSKEIKAVPGLELVRVSLLRDALNSEL